MVPFFCIFFQVCQNGTSNFRKVVGVVQQHTEGMMGSIIWAFIGNLPGFPAVKEF